MTTNEEHIQETFVETESLPATTEPAPTLVANPFSTAGSSALSEVSNRAQKLVRSERERLRDIESTVTDLMQILAKELASSEARLEQLETDLASPGNVVECFRAEFQDWKQKCVDHVSNNSVAAGMSASEVEQRLIDTEQSLFDAHNEQEDLRRQLSKAHKQLNLRATELNELRSQLVEISMSNGDSHAIIASEKREIFELRAERNSLTQRLTEAESHLQQYSNVDLSEVDNLRRRFELAVQDLRETKSRNGQLEAELTKLKGDGTAAKAAVSGVASDWESRKKLLMAQLEADFSDDDPAQRRDRLSIEETLRATDQIISAKEQEILELRQRLHNEAASSAQRQQNGEDNDAVLDADEVIQRGRQRLQKLEAEWLDKQRRAEVEIAVERAKLARERQLLDEKLRAIEKDGHQIATGNNGSAEGTKGAAKPASKGGRWLARLGLKDDKS